MTVFLVRQGYSKNYVLDMDHVSFTALYDMVYRETLTEKADRMELDSVAAQADGAGIKKVSQNLRIAAGTAERKSDMDAFRKRLAGN